MSLNAVSLFNLSDSVDPVLDIYGEHHIILDSSVNPEIAYDTCVFEMSNERVPNADTVPISGGMRGLAVARVKAGFGGF